MNLKECLQPEYQAYAKQVIANSQALTEGLAAEGLRPVAGGTDTHLALLDLQDRLRDAGGGVKICGLTETGRKVFEITRLDRRFEVFDSLIDAVGSFR